ncbi:MAG: response regulator [Pseudobutyrivibrio ruminis]|nr:response regulator [Pseudobutyrivibrio ruminis]
MTAVGIGLMGILCYAAIADNEYKVSVFSNFSLYFCGALFPTIIVSIILYYFYNHASERIKGFFPIGYMYTNKYKNNTLLRNRHKKTKISKKITAIIVSVEIILGISVGGFIVVLFPDIKEMMLENYQNVTEVSMVEDISADATDGFEAGIDNIEYKLNKYAISFDIKMLLLILCVGVPMAGIANYYTKTKIGEPIGVLAEFLDYFIRADDEVKLDSIKYIDSVTYNTHDEIQVLDRSLKATMQEFADFVSRKEEEQKLEAELEIAKQASEAKSSFLSNMSHEIRTPINSVLGMNEMIIRECEDEQILEYANNAKSAGNTLLGLVNDILDFSKIEAGKMEIINAQYHLGSLINDLVNMVSAKAADKGLEFEINVDEHIPCILIGDDVRIKQCVTNLLSNAVKYTDKGTVTLNVGYETLNDIGINLTFEVKDTGIGIKEDDLKKLYSPFERIEEERNRSIEGTGLGMSIVKRLLTLMETQLQVESTYGKGSSFRFAVKQQVVSQEEIGDFKEKYKEFIRSKNKYHQRFEAPDARILVVDDTEMNLTVIKSLLKQTKIKVETAASGFETLDKIQEKKYDVILLDHRMPKMDGIETLERMKILDNNLNKEVPVIALTANAVSGAKAEYQAHGFTDYLAKPVDGALLEKMLEHYISPEKIVSVSVANGDDDYKSDFSEIIPEDSFLSKLEDIDLETAVKNCGDYQVLENVIKDFLVSIDTKADAIEKFLEEKDLRNYTVLVHALKSSARLIGAMDLSNKAALLEEKGNEGDLSKLLEMTPSLLSQYRSYKEKLSCAMEKDNNLPEISEYELNEAFGVVKELVEAYDFNTADSVMKSLEQYIIPEKFEEKYSTLIRLMSAVDRDAILNLL